MSDVVRAVAPALRLTVLTPLATVLDEPVESIVAPLPDGWIGILPGHAPFEARLMRGALVLSAGRRRRTVATIGGVISVSPDAVAVLTGAAAVDRDLETLEHEIGAETARLQEMEREAEKHFDRIYRALAHTFERGGRHD